VCGTATTTAAPARSAHPPATRGFFLCGCLAMHVDDAHKTAHATHRTSLANDGPLRKTAGCRRPSAPLMTSLIIAPLPTSRPLLTHIMGTSLGSTSRTLVKNARLCCTGTACTAYEAPAMASAASVVARTLAGSTKPCGAVSMAARKACRGKLISVQPLHPSACSACAEAVRRPPHRQVLGVGVAGVDVPAEVRVAQQQYHIQARLLVSQAGAHRGAKAAAAKDHNLVCSLNGAELRRAPLSKGAAPSHERRPALLDLTALCRRVQRGMWASHARAAGATAAATAAAAAAWCGPASSKSATACSMATTATTAATSTPTGTAASTAESLERSCATANCASKHCTAVVIVCNVAGVAAATAASTARAAAAAAVCQTGAT
jgi:hypothetical protein